MKRVVKGEGVDAYRLYLARIEKDKWAMFKEMPPADFRLMRLFDDSGYSFGLSYPSLSICINEAINDGWEVYEFKSFRSAMEYYLEQSK